MTDPSSICGHEHWVGGVREICTLPPDHPLSGVDHHYENAEQVERAMRPINYTPPSEYDDPRPACPVATHDGTNVLVCAHREHGPDVEHEFVTPRELYRRALQESVEIERRREAARRPHRDDRDATGVGLGRAHNDLSWRRTHRADPDAWKPPDGGERSITPEPHPPTDDIEGHPLSVGEGRAVVTNAEEMTAAVGNVIAHIRLWQEQGRVLSDQINASVANAQGLLGRQSVDAVNQALRALVAASEDVENALGKGEFAIEQLAGWSVTFGGTGE